MYDTLIIGTGLSSIFFLEGYKNKKEKIAVISYESTSDTNFKKNDQSLKKKILANLPPRFNSKNFGAISNFFTKNEITNSENSSIFGLLQEGGVSNYWGMSCDFPKDNKLNFLNSKNQDSLIRSFNYIYNTFNLEGSVSNKNIKTNKNKKIEDYFSKFLEVKENNINFYKNCSAINSSKCLKISNKCWNDCPTKSTLLPKMISDFKNVDKFNYFANKISKSGDVYEVNCINSSNEKKIFRTKKLILACGTIGTTRLLLDMLNYESPIRIFHNPMLFSCILSIKKVQKNLKHWLSQVASESFDLETGSFAVANFRTTNEHIKEKIFKDYWFMRLNFFKYIFSFFEKKMVFVNLYIEGKYSNLNMQKTIDGYKIFSNSKKNEKIKKLLMTHLKKILKTLLKNNLATRINYTSIPKNGYDNHYTGTVKINDNTTPLSVNEMCELKNFKNIFIVDGSVVPGNISFFPTGVIIANAHRVGLGISNEAI